MAEVALLFRNIADEGTVTADDEVAGALATALQYRLASRKWRTPTSTTSSAIVLDMGEAKSIGFVGLFGVNFSAAADIRVKLSNLNGSGDAGVYDSGTLNTVNALYRRFAHFFATASARWVRIEMSDGSLGYLEAGRLSVGLPFTPNRSFSYGWSQEIARQAQVTESAGGQFWVDEEYQREVWRLEFRALSREEIDAQYDLFYQYSGPLRDIVVCRNTAASDVSRETLLGTLQPQTPISNPRPGLFDLELIVTERL